MRKLIRISRLVAVLFVFFSYHSTYAESNQPVSLFSLSAFNITTVSDASSKRLKKRISQVSTTVNDTQLNDSDTRHINYFKLAIDKALSVEASVHYQTENGTAIAGVDYIATSGTAIIPIGETSVDIAIEIITDHLNEKSESFFLVISEPVGASFPQGITEIRVEHRIIDNVITGQFIDDPVQGLGYSCSSGLAGITNTNGEYTCHQGDTVTFALGGKVLGTALAKTVVTPYSLFPNQPDAALNLARLLQSIDVDNDQTNNKIVINDDFIFPDGIEFNNALFEENIKTALAINLVNSAEAKTQLHNGITSAGGTIPSDSGSGSEANDGGNTGSPDTIAPNAPILSSTPSSTKNSSVHVEVNGEAGAIVLVNNAPVGTLNGSGKLSIALDTSGSDGDKSFSITLKDSSGNISTALAVTMTKDSTAPDAPTLTNTPTKTTAETTDVEVRGEVAATVMLDDKQVGTISSEGTLTITLDTSGNNADLSFTLRLKDALGNESDALRLTITKTSTAPTINSLQTANTSPALSGTMPTGSLYGLTVGINNSTYPATNNGDGIWSLSQGTIPTLSEGFYSVVLTLTDDKNNSTITTLVNKIEINNTGFLIDSAVEGIKYVSGSLNGYTDKDGLFKYEEGQAVTFYIGDETTGIPLGEATTKTDPSNELRKIVTLFDLAGSQDENNPKVLNSGKLLQSLDSDKDVSNGITIDQRTKESIALLGLKDKVNFTESVDVFVGNEDIYMLFNDLADHFGEHRGLISNEDTKAHLIAIRDGELATKQATSSVVRGKKEVIKILTGVLKTTTGVVEGVKFRSGNQSGLTNAEGIFSYEDGKQVSFSIYQLGLGITQGQAVITPADLVISTSFNHPKPRNIIRLLNAFDANSDDTKVTIDHAVREALEIYRSQIDLNLPDGKANTELGILKGVDEFGAQFDDFEIGKEILEKIITLRTGG